jgi:inhibitor of KinA
MKKPIFYALGEGALTVSFGDSINMEYSKQVFQLYHRLLHSANRFWLDLIPAYTTLTIVYEPLNIEHESPSVWVRENVERFLSSDGDETEKETRHVRIPVCYSMDFGMDALRLCEERNISHETLIQLHIEVTYYVYMLGFLPGFPYMGSVDPRIATPRLAKPRTLVPTGSVGIAGEQTGIYPLDSPGGWNIIGKTPLKLFDAVRRQPVLLHPGDQISFVPITKKEFQNFDSSTFNVVSNEP